MRMDAATCMSAAMDMLYLTAAAYGAMCAQVWCLRFLRLSAHYV